MVQGEQDPGPAGQAEGLLADCAGSRDVSARVETGGLIVELPGNYGTVLGVGR